MCRGMDWAHSTIGMCVASAVCIGIVVLSPQSLWNVWVGLAAFMGLQVVTAAARLLSGQGPWQKLQLWSLDANRFVTGGGGGGGSGGSSPASDPVPRLDRTEEPQFAQ